LQQASTFWGLQVRNINAFSQLQYFVIKAVVNENNLGGEGLRNWLLFRIDTVCYPRGFYQISPCYCPQNLVVISKMPLSFIINPVEEHRSDVGYITEIILYLSI
jgi:hypothetical protein